MAGFSLDVAAICAFTVLAVLFGTWWLYKKLKKGGEKSRLKPDVCNKNADVMIVKDFYEFRRLTSRKENEGFTPLAIHGKDMSICQSKLWAEGTGSNILRKYMTEIVSENSERLKNAIQEAIEKLSCITELKTENEIQDITEIVFSAIFTEMQLIMFGHLHNLQLEETLNLMQDQVKLLTELWPAYPLEGIKLERDHVAQHESVIEDRREKLLNSIIHVLKRKSDANSTVSCEAYADYILNSYTTKNKEDAIKFVANHISDLLVIGTDALLRVLRSGITELLDNFRIQERILNEIGKFNGHKQITAEVLENKNSFPLTRAVVQEMIRLTPMPVAVFRENQGESPEGEKNETGKIIAADLRSMLTDPEIWKNPNAFDPDRFLDPLRKNVLQKEEFIPFCAGDRSCPAEELVEISSMIVIAYLVQKFHLKRPVGSEGNHHADGNETTTEKREPRLTLIVKSRNPSEKQS